jgi:hypothetical protein
MTLFIDVDRNSKTGWQGYDLAINRKQVGSTTTVEHTANGKSWVKAADIQYAYTGNQLEIRVPRRFLQTAAGLNFEFKWSDNRQRDNDIMDFWVNGDVAPAGRYNYLLRAK